MTENTDNISLYAAYKADAARIDAAIEYAVQQAFNGMTASECALLDWSNSLTRIENRQAA